MTLPQRLGLTLTDLDERAHRFLDQTIGAWIRRTSQVVDYDLMALDAADVIRRGGGVPEILCRWESDAGKIIINAHVMYAEMFRVTCIVAADAWTALRHDARSSAVGPVASPVPAEGTGVAK
jgi:hypothetical protein